MKRTNVYLILTWLIISILVIKVTGIKTELQKLNQTLTEINYAMVEQNAILKYNPMDEK